jgi:hypothetical protein
MARTIRVGDIGDYANSQMEKLLRSAVLETELLLKMASPVDTGRFRASWATGENTAGSYDGGEQQPATGQYKDATSPPKDPSLERRISIGYQSGQERIGNVYSVHNNLPYAEPLANGSSKQANAGWVQGIAKDVQGRVRSRRTHRQGVMSSTYNDIRAAIEGRIATQMAIAPVYPVSYQNVPFTPPNNTPWLQVFLRLGDNNYATLLPTGSAGFNRQNGTLVVNVFTPIGVGAAANFTIAERIKDLFDRAKFSSIIFDPASGPAQVTPAAPEPYFQTQLTATFEAYVD